ncbi:Heparanase-like protein 3 [Zea mays]|uniref:Heparanase-like protein 3 n=1 Tax=Zea mays TaxID=4577 RepID=A0A1D6NEB8_MAIZE|nr:Heparanase-like protein 3 [Zea mays]
MPDDSLGGPWNYTNAASFIRYTVSKGYDVHGWELEIVAAGNELSGSGVRARIDADQYAADVIALKHIVDSAYQGKPSKPLVLASGGFFDAVWFTQLVSKTKPDQMDAITHHIYNLGPATFSNLQGILKSAGTSAVAWVGEAGGTYNSCHHLVTDAFVFSFCALLWHRLMGTKVLSTTFNSTNKIRAYAHCVKNSEGIALLLINLDGISTNRIYVTSQGAHAQSERKKGSGTSDVHIIPVGLGEAAAALTRQEYHLTPKDGNLQSQQLLLNGNVLATDADGEIPELEPVQVEGTQPITVGPYSTVFAHVPSFYAPTCL